MNRLERVTGASALAHVRRGDAGQAGALAVDLTRTAWGSPATVRIVKSR